MKRYAFALLGVALLVQVAWMIGDSLIWHAPGSKIPLDSAIVLLGAAFAVSYGRWPWLSVVVRIGIAITFLDSLADRFGVLGPPGAPGVSWGNWANFVIYTRMVNGFLPASFAPTLAVLATAAEIVLSAALVLGVQLRLAALGAGLLTLTYAVAMTISLPIQQMFHFAVLVFATAGFALATLDTYPASVDSLIAQRRRPVPA